MKPTSVMIRAKAWWGGEGGGGEGGGGEGGGGGNGGGGEGGTLQCMPTSRYLVSSGRPVPVQRASAGKHQPLVETLSSAHVAFAAAPIATHACSHCARLSPTKRQPP